MTDEELIRLLTNFHYAILDSLGQAPVQLDEDGEHRTVDASRAAILAYFERRKSGEGGERPPCNADMVLLPYSVVMSLRGITEVPRHQRIIDAALAARTEGKGNG